MRFISHFNVCYWRHTAASIKRRQRWIRVAIAGIGFGASVLYLVFTKEWATSLIAAVCSFIISFLGAIANKAGLAEARFAVERWSELATDADSLWEYGKARGWEETAVAESLEGLRERERQFEAREDHVPNDDRRRECKRITCQELQVLPEENGHV